MPVDFASRLSAILEPYRLPPAVEASGGYPDGQDESGSQAASRARPCPVLIHYSRDDISGELLLARADGRFYELYVTDDDRSYRDAIFDIVVGEVGMTSDADPADAVHYVAPLAGTMAESRLPRRSPAASTSQSAMPADRSPSSTFPTVRPVSSVRVPSGRVFRSCVMRSSLVQRLPSATSSKHRAVEIRR